MAGSRTPWLTPFPSCVDGSRTRDNSISSRMLYQTELRRMWRTWEESNPRQPRFEAWRSTAELHVRTVLFFPALAYGHAAEPPRTGQVANLSRKGPFRPEREERDRMSHPHRATADFGRPMKARPARNIIALTGNIRKASREFFRRRGRAIGRDLPVVTPLLPGIRAMFVTAARQERRIPSPVPNPRRAASL